MARMVLRRACWAKAVSLSKVMDLRSAGSMRAKIASMTEMVSAAVFPTGLACERRPGFACVKNKHGPCALAEDKVTFPMAGLASGVDILGPFMDGNAILNCISPRPRSAATAAVVESGGI